MIYLSLALGVGLVLLYLLWRGEVARRKKAELERDLANAAVATLRELLELERRLHKAAATDRPALEAKIREIESKALSAKPGEKVEDIFGTGAGTQEGGAA